MKLVIAGIALSALLATSAPGQNLREYRGEIPFAFHIGSVSYDAGQYRVFRSSPNNPSGWEIVGTGSVSGLFFAMPSDPGTYDGGHPILRFNCYGRTCFLSGIRGAETYAVWSLSPSLLERETARRAASLEARIVHLTH
ncbi:MAG TPA: hypothetical protein VFA04_24440 [Bryobacteraceae bacterium]|jgi:hypothetical protein|nr:hypothetical protein [Bryobacteraceae bacterium]